MIEKNVDNEINKRMLNEEMLEELLIEKDDYGENTLHKILEKIKYADRMSIQYNADKTVINSIMVGYDLTKNILENGKEFLEEINSSKEEYVENLIKKILNNIDDTKVKEISNGINNILNNMPNSLEEQIVEIVNYGYNYADSLADRNSVPIFMGSYESKILKESNKRGRIVAIEIPKNDLEKREKVNNNYSEKIKKIKQGYEYYNNSNLKDKDTGEK